MGTIIKKFNQLEEADKQAFFSELLSDDNENPLLYHETCGGINHTFPKVNICILPDITGRSDAFKNIIEQLYKRLNDNTDNINFWRFFSPQWSASIFKKYNVEIPTSIPDLSEFYLAIMEFKQLPPDILVGWSFGGSLTIELGTTINKRYESEIKMLIVDAYPYLEENPEPNPEHTWEMFENFFSMLKNELRDDSKSSYLHLTLKDIVNKDKFLDESVKYKLEFLANAFKDYLRTQRSFLGDKVKNYELICEIILDNIKAYKEYTLIKKDSPCSTTDLSNINFYFCIDTVDSIAHAHPKDATLGWRHFFVDNTSPTPSDLTQSSQSDGSQTDGSQNYGSHEDLSFSSSASTITPVQILSGDHFTMLGADSEFCEILEDCIREACPNVPLAPSKAQAYRP